VEENPEGDGAAGHIKEELRDVGPDNSLHAALEGVENGQRDDDDDCEAFGGAEDHAYDQRDSGDADPFGDGACDEKRAGSDRTHFFAEMFFDYCVGGQELAAKIAGEKNQNDKDAAD